MSHKPLSDADEVAAILRRDARWLKDECRAGRFPARKIGRRWMFTQSDIEQILALCAVNQ